MEKIIIFDFNRTLYSPQSEKLIPGTRSVLRTLLKEGFTLFLVSRDARGRRKLIEELGITQYFSRIFFAKKKTQENFKRILEGHNVSPQASFVIGDRVREEVSIGNALGLQTIWVCRGKFAAELPVQKQQRPTHTVKDLREILRIVR